MPTESADLLAALLGAPPLPGALCAGRANLFDPQDVEGGENHANAAERHDRAIGLCRICPALTDCRTWATTLVDGEVSGVVAGEFRKPPTRSITVPPKNRRVA